MTRAKDQLNLMVPQRFHVTQQRHHGDRHLYASLTRFITPEVAACFDALHGGPNAVPDEPASVDTLIDVAAPARARRE
jgi:DNA helicase II / ATP-dependent DNA helicase PcrA